MIAKLFYIKVSVFYAYTRSNVHLKVILRPVLGLAFYSSHFLNSSVTFVFWIKYITANSGNVMVSINSRDLCEIRCVHPNSNNNKFKMLNTYPHIFALKAAKILRKNEEICFQFEFRLIKRIEHIFHQKVFTKHSETILNIKQRFVHRFAKNHECNQNR